VTDFNQDPMLQSLSAFSFITENARANLRRIGAEHPTLPDDLFTMLIQDLGRPAIVSADLSGLSVFEDVFRPMVTSVIRRMFRAELSDADLEEIELNAKNLEAFGMAPSIQFGVYANVHGNCCSFVRGLLGVGDADEVISAMAGFWLMIGGLFTQSYVDARRRKEAVLIEEAKSMALESGRDPLTNVGNRSMLNRLADQGYDESGSGLIFIDLDRFKYVNDTFGHLVGDALLCQVAERMLAVCRSEDSVVRFGGDEFVIVVRSTPVHHIPAMAERILNLLNRSFSVEGQVIKISASIGVSALLPNERMKQSLSRADEAAYRAKRSGGNSVFAMLGSSSGASSGSSSGSSSGLSSSSS
jgi:diguanylate cyclase (GGDEF)-like protein